jgi:23S rRNA (uridine2479-2'-O)-methyltransferase
MAGPPLRRIRTANDEFQLAESLLTNRRQRAKQGRFVVEGVRAVDQAVEHGWPIDSFWYAAGARLSRWARGLLDSGVARARYEVAPELMERLSGKEETSELVAIAETAPDDLARIAVGPDALVVVFDRPVSPGNLGSVIRSSEALGAHGVVVTGHAADVYDPQTVRASVGALFAIPVVRSQGDRELDDWIARLRAELPSLAVVGSSAHATTPLEEVDFARPTLLVVGNETRGLSQAWRERCDELVRIPMAGSADSLNAAAAASILLYEAARGRRG